jgi:hypothetical protein
MIDALLPVVLFISVATLAVAIGALLSSRRSQTIAQDRYELLRTQQDRSELLQEERRMLREELEKTLQGRRPFVGEERPQEEEGPEQERQERAESTHRAEEQAQERELLEQELERLGEELERERQGRLEVQQRVEQLNQERLRLERELSRSKERSSSGQPWAHPWWRKPIAVAALLVGALILWLTSLVVALILLNP